MEQMNNTKRACAVAAAAAHSFNNELTVILSSVNGVQQILEPGHPAHPLLLDIQAAAQRCVWNAHGLLTFSARVNSGPVRASFDYLINE